MESIPSPRGYPLIGNVLDIDPEKPNQSLAQLFAIHGPIIKLRLPAERIFVSSYALANELFDETRFEKAVTGPLAQVRHAAGDGLFTALPEEHNWALAHRLLMPAFGPQPIRSMFPEMQDVISQMVLKWARFGPDEEIDVSADFTRLTLDSIAICAMGSRFNSFYREHQHEFVDAMVAILTECFSRSRRPPLPEAFFATKDRQFQQEIDKLEGIAKSLLQARRQHPIDKPDLLNTMIKARDTKTGETLPDEVIIRNMITFLIAGHETTSGLLSFLFYELMANPSAYATAQEEVDRVIGKEPLDIKHMSKLPIVEGCLRETLRLYPTAPAFTVRAKGKQVIGEKYTIQDQQPITIFLSGLHRDKQVYGADAESFKPKRMVGENFENLPSGAWKPFGNGVRACIGRPFAWQEAILAVATLLQTFTFTKAQPSYQLAIQTSLTMKPRDFHIKARLRNDSFLDSTHALASHSAAPKETATGSSKSHGQPGQNLKPIQIFYGSNTGTCEAVANALATSAESHGYHASVVSMDDGIAVFEKDQPLVVVTASYEGEPADNGAHFMEWLSSNPKAELQDVRYAVFGLGNKEWFATYQKIPTTVDEALARNGAQRITNRVALNVTEVNIFDSLDEWAEAKLWPALGATSTAAAGPPELKILLETKRRAGTLKQDMHMGEVMDTKLLTTKVGAPRKRHIQIRLPSGLSYRAGDYLAILPLNPPDTVRRVMKYFQLPWDAVVTIDNSATTTLPKGEALGAYELLSGMLEISQPVTAKVVLAIADVSQDDAQKQALRELASNERALRFTSLLNVLEAFPTSAFSFGAFLAAMPAMRIRQYSISSSPFPDPTSCTLTYSVLDAPRKDSLAAGNYIGVCSTYLERLAPDDKVHVALRPSRSGFHVPDDDLTPLIMACAGTGLAPFRAFMAERAYKKEAGVEVGTSLLFYGLNAPDEDDMYKEQFDAWERLGVVSVRRAYTHVPEKSYGCRFVQDGIWHDRKDTVELFRKSVTLYFCGAGILGAGVDKVMAQTFAEARNCSLEEAQEWVSDQKGSRFWADNFG